MAKFKQLHLKAVFKRNQQREQIFDYVSGDKLPFSYFSYEAIKKHTIQNHGAGFMIRNWATPRLYSGLIPMNYQKGNCYFFGDHRECKSTFIFYFDGPDEVTIIYFKDRHFAKVDDTKQFLVDYCDALCAEKGTSTARHSLSVSSNKELR